MQIVSAAEKATMERKREELFKLQPAYPAANLEPYYTGWNHPINRPGGETPEENSDRDNYFSRAMMYGSVLSGGLAGHVHGTAAYDVTSTGEPAGWRPYIWTALKYQSGSQMQYLKKFVLSEGARYQQLQLASSDVSTRRTQNASDTGLDGWSFLMRTEDKSFALAYFENKAQSAQLSNFKPKTRYDWIWFDPRTGDWSKPVAVTTDAQGAITTPPFPASGHQATLDVAAKILAR